MGAGQRLPSDEFIDLVLNTATGGRSRRQSQCSGISGCNARLWRAVVDQRDRPDGKRAARYVLGLGSGRQPHRRHSEPGDLVIARAGPQGTCRQRGTHLERFRLERQLRRYSRRCSTSSRVQSVTQSHVREATPASATLSCFAPSSCTSKELASRALGNLDDHLAARAAGFEVGDGRGHLLQGKRLSMTDVTLPSRIHVPVCSRSACRSDE